MTETDRIFQGDSTELNVLDAMGNQKFLKRFPQTSFTLKLGLRPLSAKAPDPVAEK